MANRRNKWKSKIPLGQDASGALIYDYHPKTKVGRRRLVRLLVEETKTIKGA
jgi:hypothetical protein